MTKIIMPPHAFMSIGCPLDVAEDIERLREEHPATIIFDPNYGGERKNPSTPHMSISPSMDLGQYIMADETKTPRVYIQENIGVLVRPVVSGSTSDSLMCAIDLETRKYVNLKTKKYLGAVSVFRNSIKTGQTAWIEDQGAVEKRFIMFRSLTATIGESQIEINLTEYTDYPLTGEQTWDSSSYIWFLPDAQSEPQRFLIDELDDRLPELVLDFRGGPVVSHADLAMLIALC